MCPNKIQKAELNEGECWDRVGAVITWNYVIDEVGERAIVKTKIEELNDENRCVRYSHLGGKIVEKYYKETLISKIQLTPKDEGCTVTWSFEYEKMNENVPEPDIYANYLLGVAKDIGASLCNA
ncbi:MLP-like protein 31 [Chenopodium quinoa]|uniref:Bet v I/Major latex protein domain-containing protein n=1 Tax=Chenopodium quinoa TaxID=63459 RepID=A0A803NEL4_CHEQI|nr:MLP-like protein 31 [Chenopodium quinoa]XP_021766623.1 MLP-like protein 31 [Chenopodium quinoa]